jgi:hypothetical protein
VLSDAASVYDYHEGLLRHISADNDSSASLLFSARFCIVDLVCNKEATEPLVWQWIGMDIVILLTCTVIIGSVESLDVMFNLLSEMICSLIFYFFPSLFYIQICKEESIWKTVLAWVMTIGDHDGCAIIL